MKELIDLISLVDPKSATKVRKVVRIAKAVDKMTTPKKSKK
jgi:hypothetical protein